eukprot:241636-Prymnesium_polylepis.1
MISEEELGPRMNPEIVRIAHLISNQRLQRVGSCRHTQRCARMHAPRPTPPSTATLQPPYRHPTPHAPP